MEFVLSLATAIGLAGILFAVCAWLGTKSISDDGRKKDFLIATFGVVGTLAGALAGGIITLSVAESSEESARESERRELRVAIYRDYLAAVEDVRDDIEAGLIGTGAIPLEALQGPQDLVASRPRPSPEEYLLRMDRLSESRLGVSLVGGAAVVETTDELSASLARALASLLSTSPIEESSEAAVAALEDATSDLVIGVDGGDTEAPASPELPEDPASTEPPGTSREDAGGAAGEAESVEELQGELSDAVTVISDGIDTYVDGNGIYCQQAQASGAGPEELVACNSLQEANNQLDELLDQMAEQLGVASS